MFASKWPAKGTFQSLETPPVCSSHSLSCAFFGPVQRACFWHVPITGNHPACFSYNFSCWSFYLCESEGLLSAHSMHRNLLQHFFMTFPVWTQRDCFGTPQSLESPACYCHNCFCWNTTEHVWSSQFKKLSSTPNSKPENLLSITTYSMFQNQRVCYGQNVTKKTDISVIFA